MPNIVGFNDKYPDITESQKIYARAQKVMTPVTQTVAKGPSQHIQGVAPIYLQKGKGAYVWDVDGNQYIDYTMGVGPISLGYAYEAIDQAITEQLKSGITFSLMHPLEMEISELLQSILPNAESVRISKTGADVTSAAVRISRAFTGRKKVLCCGYHGWHDWYIGTTSRNNGVTEEVKSLTQTFIYNDLESVKKQLDADVACVILEPFIFELPQNNFLQELQTLCKANGSLLIFDEMWTGFRIALGGAQEYFGITPDLACYSKAVANGMPVAFLTGRRDIMQKFDEDVFFFTTFGGEALSLAAAKATIQELKKHNVPQILSQRGGFLQDGYNQIAQDLGINSYTRCVGHPVRTMITFDASAGDPLAIKSLTQQEMIKRGVLWSGFHNMSFSHSDEIIEYTLKAYHDVLPIVAQAVADKNVTQKLLGKPVEPVFRKI